MGIINTSAEVETLANTVEDSAGVYVVPAFSGLYAPYWKDSARGVIAGLTRYVTKAHIARAALEATAWQTREVLDAMNQDLAVQLLSLKVDGGMVGNHTLMQFQSDVLGVPVVWPVVAETTALGAAYAARFGGGFLESASRIAGQLGGGLYLGTENADRTSRAKISLLEKSSFPHTSIGKNKSLS